MASSLPGSDVKSYLRIHFPCAAMGSNGERVDWVDVEVSEDGAFKIPKVTVEDGVGNLSMKQYEAIERAAQEVVNNEFIRTQITVEFVTISTPARW